jgi:nucleoside 2-deoxyribosyltransferase-like protein
MTDATLPERRKVRVLILAPRSEASIDVIRHLMQEPIDLYFRGDREIEIVTLDPHGEYGGLVSEVALQIPRTLESADAVIADLTGTDPNVMYELGFAHALKKPVLPIVRKGNASIPGDLQGYLYYVYDLEDPFELTRTVARWLERTLGERRP